MAVQAFDQSLKAAPDKQPDGEALVRLALSALPEEYKIFYHPQVNKRDYIDPYDRALEIVIVHRQKGILGISCKFGDIAEEQHGLINQYQPRRYFYKILDPAKQAQAALREMMVSVDKDWEQGLPVGIAVFLPETRRKEFFDPKSIFFFQEDFTAAYFASKFDDMFPDLMDATAKAKFEKSYVIFCNFLKQQSASENPFERRQENLKAFTDDNKHKPFEVARKRLNQSESAKELPRDDMADDLEQSSQTPPQQKQRAVTQQAKQQAHQQKQKVRAPQEQYNAHPSGELPQAKVLPLRKEPPQAEPVQKAQVQPQAQPHGYADIPSQEALSEEQIYGEMRGEAAAEAEARFTAPEKDVPGQDVPGQAFQEFDAAEFEAAPFTAPFEGQAESQPVAPRGSQARKEQQADDTHLEQVPVEVVQEPRENASATTMRDNTMRQPLSEPRRDGTLRKGRVKEDAPHYSAEQEAAKQRVLARQEEADMPELLVFFRRLEDQWHIPHSANVVLTPAQWFGCIAGGAVLISGSFFIFRNIAILLTA